MPTKPNSIVFINCPIREGAQPNNPPLGILYLAAQLKRVGYENISILDLNVKRNEDGSFLSVDQVKAEILNHFSIYGDPDFVGISGLITTLRWQKTIAKIVRIVSPCSFLCSGGGLATEFEGKLFDWIPELDAVCIGEGEGVIEDIIEASNNPDGKQKIFYGIRFQTMDSLPVPDFSMIPSPELEEYIKVPVWGESAKNSSIAPFTSDRSLSIISSRGCPYSCKFCYRKMQGGREYKAHSAERVVYEMMSLWSAHKLDFIGIIDDNFTINKERIGRIREILAGKNIPWGTHGRMDMADERIDWMAGSGCKYIGFGAESASINVLKSMGKGGKILSDGFVNIGGYSFPKSMVNAILRCQSAGIHSNCTWIMGFPGETLDDLKTSVAFIQWQKSIASNPEAVNASMFVATAYPGTEMWSMKEVQDKLSEVDLENYVLQLDDATKLIQMGDGRILNYSAMPDDVFLQAKEYIEKGYIEEILKM